MSEPDTPEARPVAANSWPQTLDAHVVSPGPDPRVHGYCLRSDLARHYDFGEFVITALVGVPPTPSWGKAVNMALIVLAGAGVDSAGVHVATLARRCGADDRSTLQTGMLGLVEEVSAEVAHPPASGVTASALEFYRSLPQDVQTAIGEPACPLRPYALRVLAEAGLSSPMQQMLALSIARLPTLAAEAIAAPSGDVRGYPMQLPKFDYQPPSGNTHE